MVEYINLIRQAQSPSHKPITFTNVLPLLSGENGSALEAQVILLEFAAGRLIDHDLVGVESEDNCIDELFGESPYAMRGVLRKDMVFGIRYYLHQANADSLQKLRHASTTKIDPDILISAIEFEESILLGHCPPPRWPTTLVHFWRDEVHIHASFYEQKSGSHDVEVVTKRLPLVSSSGRSHQWNFAKMEYLGPMRVGLVVSSRLLSHIYIFIFALLSLQFERRVRVHTDSGGAGPQRGEVAVFARNASERVDT
ncbi:hypothetical protein B0H19DRAFT_1234835 [Mycena capillaripes]|nr:hypothetical protein B0H19DRAFT_1234835 [Mycena capillaripes]